MDILLVFSGIIFSFLVVLLYEYRIRLLRRPRNNIHFYVARNKNGGLWLYLNKPVRADVFFACSHGQILSASENFSKYGLNALDYTNLKWEDEPVEVFLNLED